MHAARDVTLRVGVECAEYLTLRLEPILKGTAGSASPGFVELVGAHSDSDLQSRVRSAVLKVLRQNLHLRLPHGHHNMRQYSNLCRLLLLSDPAASKYSIPLKTERVKGVDRPKSDDALLRCFRVL